MCVMNRCIYTPAQIGAPAPSSSSDPVSLLEHKAKCGTPRGRTIPSKSSVDPVHASPQYPHTRQQAMALKRAKSLLENVRIVGRYECSRWVEVHVCGVMSVFSGKLYH